MSLRRWILIAGAALGAVATAAFAQSQYGSIDPPARVGRLADLRGSVWVFDAEDGRWTPAERNRPLIEGDRLAVDDDGRAELRVGPNVLRLAGGTEIELRRLDDQRMDLELLAGSLALRVATREMARQTAVFTDEGRFEPLRAGHYRFDREDEVSHAAAWRGELQFSGAENLLRIDEGERFRVWVDGRRGVARTQSVPMPSDRFGAWALAADRAASQTQAYRYVSPEMTGAEDLDRHGRWDAHPEFGYVWAPNAVPVGWAPYRDGRWVWMRPWGWTWVDAAPWGFAPSHYGRWVQWQARWVWWPGPRHARPVFAPALVAQVSGSHVGVSVTIDLGSRHAPPVSWVPLAPYQPYVPIYRAPPQRHLHPPPRPGHRPPAPRPPRPPRQVPTGPIGYGPDGVPSGVTAVPAQRPGARPPAAQAVVPAAPTVPRTQERPNGRREPLPVQRQRDPTPTPAPVVQPIPRAGLPAQPTARERWNGQGNERALERKAPRFDQERDAERTRDRATGRAGEPVSERVGERASERASERAVERASERGTERAGERRNGPPAERPDAGARPPVIRTAPAAPGPAFAAPSPRGALVPEPAAVRPAPERAPGRDARAEPRRRDQVN